MTSQAVEGTWLHRGGYKWLRGERVKYKDLNSLSQVLQEGQYTQVITGTSKSGYHVDISLAHQKLLGFSWPSKGVLRYFAFTVLAFGLSQRTKKVMPNSLLLLDFAIRLVIFVLN